MPSNICDLGKAPAFKQIVEKALALFAVYTGATLSFFVKEFLFSNKDIARQIPLEWPGYWEFWATLAVVALLLRYIVGSAVHLSSVYTPTTTQKITDNNITIETAPRQSTSLCNLFIDLLFLIAFGILAMFITLAAKENNLEVLMESTIYFIGAGFVWSLVAWLLRPDEREFSVRWLVVDGVQIALTILIILLPFSELLKAIIFGVTYLSFLFVDLWSMVKVSQGLECPKASPTPH